MSGDLDLIRGMFQDLREDVRSGLSDVRNEMRESIGRIERRMDARDGEAEATRGRLQALELNTTEALDRRFPWLGKVIWASVIMLCIAVAYLTGHKDFLSIFQIS